MLLASGDKGQPLELTEKLRKRKLNATRKVLYLNRSPNGNTAEIAMLGDFQSSIRRRLIEGGVIFKKLEISGGFEYYTVFSLMCDKECLSDLRLDLSSCPKVLEFSYFPVNPPLMGEMTLTPQEKRIVRIAYERGDCSAFPVG